MRMILAAAMVLAAAPAAAQSDYAARALLSGNLEAAEQQLDHRRSIEPTEPSVLLNTAFLYEQTGRRADAQRLYATVLQGDNVALDLASGRTVMSHDLARRALSTNGIASR